jgi:hypothetical protein
MKKSTLYRYVVPNTTGTRMVSLVWDEGEISVEEIPIIAWHIELHGEDGEYLWVTPMSYEEQASNEKRLIIRGERYVDPEVRFYDDLEEAKIEFHTEQLKLEKPK